MGAALSSQCNWKPDTSVNVVAYECKGSRTSLSPLQMFEYVPLDCQSIDRSLLYPKTMTAEDTTKLSKCTLARYRGDVSNSKMEGNLHKGK